LKTADPGGAADLSAGLRQGAVAISPVTGISLGRNATSASDAGTWPAEQMAAATAIVSVPWPRARAWSVSAEVET
jgi:hypothetical protein